MEVLNVIEPHMSTGHIIGIVVIVACMLFGLMIMIACVIDGVEVSGVIGGFLVIAYCTFLLLAVATEPNIPERYEVRITDEDYVINAEEYKIVEKRGEVYVLEEISE